MWLGHLCLCGQLCPRDNYVLVDIFVIKDISVQGVKDVPLSNDWFILPEAIQAIIKKPQIASGKETLFMRLVLFAIWMHSVRSFSSKSFKKNFGFVSCGGFPLFENPFYYVLDNSIQQAKNFAREDFSLLDCWYWLP